MRIPFTPSRHPLMQTLHTQRFTLAPLGRFQAFRLSYPWTRDPELMLNLTFSTLPRSRWQWYRQMWAPNQRTKFAHAILPAGSSVPIGMHALRIFNRRSATMYVALHDRAWRGKGVVPEIRTAIIDHAFRHDIVDRFYGEVHANNQPAAATYRKLGFTHIGPQHHVGQDTDSQNVTDRFVFELWRQEWEAGPNGK